MKSVLVYCVTNPASPIFAMHSTRSIAMSRIQLAVSLCDAMSLNPKTIATISGEICVSPLLSISLSLYLPIFTYVYCQWIIRMWHRERTLRIITEHKLRYVGTFVILLIKSNLIKFQCADIFGVFSIQIVRQVLFSIIITFINFVNTFKFGFENFILFPVYDNSLCIS